QIDKTYSNKAALIKNYSFDRVKFKISGPTYKNTDLTHWLALDVSERAIRDAGFNDLNIPKDRTGVLIGNSLTGEFSRA
ncbi:beta-ketoacyl synthase N-terminal-like domain-containing protein, partial [Escherichia coli]|nr:beta-ketoacyl synthase N-terminal-like domain-containing protein [Escherichia coli]